MLRLSVVVPELEGAKCFIDILGVVLLCMGLVYRLPLTNFLVILHTPGTGKHGARVTTITRR